MIDKKIIVIALTTIGASLGMVSTFLWMESFRPYLIGITILLLAYMWLKKIKLKKQDLDCACEVDDKGKISFFNTKTFLMLITIFVVVMLLFPYYSKSIVPQNKSIIVLVKASNILKREILVEGMTCMGCELSVESSVKLLPGILNIKASSGNKNVKVEFDKSLTSIEEIMDAIGQTGYKPMKYKEIN
jgi:copper chaperone CopZ